MQNFLVCDNNCNIAPMQLYEGYLPEKPYQNPRDQPVNDVEAGQLVEA
jgi:hypothetical protein